MSSDVASSQPASPPLSQIEQRAARYVFEIADLSDGEDDRVATGDLQDRLGVTPASVTEMVSTLDERGLVEYEKYRGVALTDRGEAVARRVGWRFCVVSSFFDSELDATLDDRTAFRMGFVLPEEGVRRLREMVAGPCLDRCPASGSNAAPCIA